MHLTSEQVAIFLLSISLMLLMAKLFGEIFTKLRQPAIIGEILAGIFLGPTVLGMISPDTFNWLFRSSVETKIIMDGITTLAVVMLLIVTGLEVDLSIVIKQGKAAVATGLMGMVIPFVLGFLFALALPELFGVFDNDMKLVFALFLGTALSISALPVIAKTLMDLNIFKSKIGLTIISAAMLNDVLGWIIFSILLGMIGVSKIELNLAETILLIVLFSGIVLFIGRRLFDKIIPVINKKLSYPGGILNFVFILGFIGAAFTEYIGIHAIFGAFIVGLAIGDSVHLPHKSREMIQQFVTNIFAPLFFVSIGLRVNFIENFNLLLVVLILVLAFLGKVIGSGIGARMGGMSKNDSLAVGFGMNSRGAMEIILGLLALQYGLINEYVFVALVIMALVTSITSAPLMSIFLRKKHSLNNLLRPELVFYTDLQNKEEVLKFLSDIAAKNLDINSEVISDELINQEKINPSGIINHLAIPHIRMNSNKPLLVAAINKDGIDFNSPDNLSSRIIFLLLIPTSESEMQFKLLSEISRNFSDKTKVEELLNTKDEEEFVEKVKQL